MAGSRERPVRVHERPADELDELNAALMYFRASPPTGARPQRLGASALVRAMTSWFFLVFGLCYVVAPVALSALGQLDGLLSHVVLNSGALLLTGFVTVVAAAVARPHVHLSPSAPRDPTLAATLGGLITWATLHNLSPLLEPFTAMGPGELLGFVAVNVLEMSLFGLMLASFTRSAAKAFALGALLQLLMVGMVSGLLMLF